MPSSCSAEALQGSSGTVSASNSREPSVRRLCEAGIHAKPWYGSHTLSKKASF